MLVAKGQNLSLVQGSHCGHCWISSLISNGIIALYSHTAAQNEDRPLFIAMGQDEM